MTKAVRSARNSTLPTQPARRNSLAVATATRVLGTETEDGISTPTNPEMSPIVTSTHAVVAYAALHTGAPQRESYGAVVCCCQ